MDMIMVNITNIEAVRFYAQFADVVVLAQLFLKLKGYPLIPDNNILMA